MAVLKVRLDNILCFEDFEADLTYPKKLVHTTLEHEYLEHYPSMRYKKVNIIIGSNATGKTSLGKAIWHTLKFVNNKEVEPLRKLISDERKEAFILLDCAFPNGLFFRLEVKLLFDGVTKVRYRQLALRKQDSYESVINRLDDSIEYSNYLEALNGASPVGWNVRFPSNESGFDRIAFEYSEGDKEDFLDIYNRLLRAFDPSIKRAFISNELSETFIVEFYNGKTVAVSNNAKLSSLESLSSGTKNVINIADIIYAIKKNLNNVYYVDEQFSYVNSDLEIACLSTMVESLGDGEQLFFTTHNTEILNLPYPLHTFAFLKKSMIGDGTFKIEMLNASSFEKRNNVGIKNLYDNDYFDIAPAIKPIVDIGVMN